MKFQDTYAIAVKSDFAKEHQLTKISDLANVSGLTAGFDVEFANRSDGNIGLKALWS